MYSSIIQRLIFRARLSFHPLCTLRKLCLHALGAQIGRGTVMPRCTINWPHQIQIGDACVLEDDIFYKYAGSWQSGPSLRIGNRVFVGRQCEFNIGVKITIEDDVLIASGCKFVDHNHSIARGEPINRQPNEDAPIHVEKDVWLGANVVVLKGVTIGTGAIVGAGAVVTKSVPAFEIWAGIPARKIGERPTV